MNIELKVKNVYREMKIMNYRFLISKLKTNLITIFPALAVSYRYNHQLNQYLFTIGFAWIHFYFNLIIYMKKVKVTVEGIPEGKK